MFKPVGDMQPVEDWHIQAVLANVRAEDRAEFECIQGQGVEQELRHAIAQSCSAQAYVVADEVVAIFGEVNLDGRSGVPWLISTYGVDKHRRSFLHHCDIQVHGMRQRYELLVNYTDARYQKALKWMEWLGFQKHAAIPYGANNELFHPFTLRGL